MSADWPIVTLEDAGVSLIDCDHKTPKAQEKGLPYVGIPQLKEGRIAIAGVRLITEEDFLQWRRKACPAPNDVVLSRRCNPGETAYVPDGLDFALGQNLVLLRTDGKRLHPPFLRWVVQGPNWWYQISKFINVGAIFDSLKCVDIPKFEIKLPPLDVQKEITQILDALDDKIELNRQINQTLEQIAQTIFKSWFVDFEPVKAKIAAKAAGLNPERAAMCAISGKTAAELDQLTAGQRQQLAATAALFPDELVESELGLVPVGWGEKPLYDTAEYVNGSAFKAKDFSDDGSGLPIIKIAELKHGITDKTKFTINKVQDKYAIKSGDMLYSWSGSPETSLDVFKWFGERGWLNQHIFKLNFSSKEKQYFTYYLLKHLKPLLIQTAMDKQTTGLGHITVADMKRIKVVYPDEIVLKAFSESIGSLYELDSRMCEQVATLSTIRDTLLPRLLSGEIALTLN